MPDIKGFKREHDLAPDTDNGDDAGGVEQPDLRAEDDALVAAALEAEEDEAPEPEEEADDDGGDADDGGDGDGDGAPKDSKPRRRRGRRGGRGRGRRRPKALEGTFDHGDEGYGLWLDPAIQDDPVYAEHWAGHRPVVISVEAERIVITRAGDNGADGGDDDES